MVDLSLEVEMYRRIRWSGLVAMFLVSVACLLHAQHGVLAELRFVPHNGADKTGGVWVDGQYMGYVKELKGNKKLLLPPGKHEIVVRQAWYKDYAMEVTLEPGAVHSIPISLEKDTRASPPTETGELKISAIPSRAAVFVDDQFAGHVDEFNGAGQAMLLTPGEHHVRIALPGYLPFETVVNLRVKQKLKIETTLVKGSITESGSLVHKNDEQK